MKVTVVESRDRIGGRVWDDDDSLGCCVGRGAQILNGCINNPVSVLCEQVMIEWLQYVAFQSYPWFKFYCPLFQTRYHTLPYPKIKDNRIQTKGFIERQQLLVECTHNT